MKTPRITGNNNQNHIHFTSFLNITILYVNNLHKKFVRFDNKKY